MARELLEDPSTEVLVSLVSAWELAIKASLGKLPLPGSIEEFFPRIVRDLLAQQVGLGIAAIGKVAVLPRHHGDPFDRLLIAQALVAECAVVTNDDRFRDYGPTVLW